MRTCWLLSCVAVMSSVAQWEISDSQISLEPAIGCIFYGEEGLTGVGQPWVSPRSEADSLDVNVRADFLSKMASIHLCYAKELRTSPDLKGKLRLMIRVNPAGKVVGVTTARRTIGGTVAECVVSTIRGWQFPKRKKGMVTISQTFFFTR